MYIDDMRYQAANNSRGNRSAEGLMLLRASMLKMIRLQLAVERQDRQAVLGAVDDLVALDRKLQAYLDALPVTPEGLMLKRELDCEHAALNEGKLILGAEVLRRPSSMLEEADQIASTETDGDWIGPCDADPQETEQPRRWTWLLAIVPILLLLIAAAAYFINLPEAAQQLEVLLGASR